MKPENLIEVHDVSMRYRVAKSRRRSFREAVFRTLLGRDEIVDIWALKDVDFILERGGSLGLIGDNGAGKSTLCLLLSQIMAPTSGKVEVAGKVSALLTLGAGFQPDLTGRDNVFLNGIYLGYTRDEIEAKFDEVVAFSELGEFIDLPVRTYSGGMRARLAFSIAASIQPQILIIDELMGVGDRNFQKKSKTRMKELISESQALVVVSHQMDTIRDLCSRTIWLDKGRIVAQGPTEEVVKQYESR
jgi:ABC-type polysaccharide/polyol phosphate transport system ATPase subunit